jgi:hypothetical protein
LLRLGRSRAPDPTRQHDAGKNLDLSHFGNAAGPVPRSFMQLLGRRESGRLLGESPHKSLAGGIRMDTVVRELAFHSAVYVPRRVRTLQGR